MALITKAAAATLAALALTGTLAQPAAAYWRATGRGTGTVPTAEGAPKVLTLTLNANSNHTVTASGTAGGSAAYRTTVTVTLCTSNTVWPCPAGSTVATLTASVAKGAYSVTSANLNRSTFYGLAAQVQTSGWTDVTATSAAVSP